MTFKTRINKHDFWPPEIPWPRWKPTQLGFIIIPDEDAKYSLPGREQEDWLKVFGLSFNWFNHQKEAAMVAMRYNPQTDLWEYTSYLHVNSKTIKGKKIADSEVMLMAPRGRKVYAWIKIDYDQKIYTVSFSHDPQTIQDSCQHPFTHNRKLAKTLGMYFGSNNKAPNVFKVFKKRITLWLQGMPDQ